MSNRIQNRGIVVGVDGSASSKQALAWALRYAETTGLPVTAVLAWEIPANYGTAAMVLPAAEFADEARSSHKQVVDEVAAAFPQVHVESRIVEGHPARILLKEAEHAQLLVVGSRGHGGFVGAVLGSVSQYCVTHAECPVLVLRGVE
ncbi:universal stress protein [Glycomyces paridis]|uniref:Universal stress protein n=1 Tax=Glycomyces paridis TaxID=2126555 RepID=A0A4S8PHW8_9ACTN|nr:universal stress protein [Glycomyces paridis]THV29012.1 universal stress protein [Glycomyces paridis]